MGAVSLGARRARSHYLRVHRVFRRAHKHGERRPLVLHVGRAVWTCTIRTVDSCARLYEFVLGGLYALSYRAADVGIIGIHRGTVTTGRRECSTVFECVSTDFGLHAYFRLAAVQVRAASHICKHAAAADHARGPPHPRGLQRGACRTLCAHCAHAVDGANFYSWATPALPSSCARRAR